MTLLETGHREKRRYARPLVTSQVATGLAPLLLVSPPPDRCCDGSPVPPTGIIDCPAGQIPGINC